MPKESKTFDIEDRLTDFAVRIIRLAEAFSIFVASIKTARQKSHKTSSFEIPSSIFDIQSGTLHKNVPG